MKVVAAVGMQWGDEGKGKIVDILSEFSSVVVRYSGGNNAGHTIRVGNEKIIFGLLPSGILRQSCRCVLGGGMVIDPFILIDEIERVKALGIKADPDRIFVSKSAFVVLPIHKQIDAILEEKRGTEIGTTKKGIGPVYQDKIGRRGLRMFEIVKGEDILRKKIEVIYDFWKPIFDTVGTKPPKIDEMVENLCDVKEKIAPYLTDTVSLIREELIKRSPILLEGAQGTLLDIDYGTYPYVTSSSSSIAGAISGCGIPPLNINEVIGISKAYTTRVGEGPFPTEAEPDISSKIREAGGEYGSMTGRPRRCGWLDIPALKRSIRINGVSLLGLTKLDVLTGFDEIPVCVGYSVNGTIIDDFPVYDLENATPVYEKWPGWKENITSIRIYDDLPSNVKKFISNIEAKTETQVGIVSVGPSRNETIMLKNPFR